MKGGKNKMKRKRLIRTESCTLDTEVALITCRLDRGYPGDKNGYFIEDNSARYTGKEMKLILENCTDDGNYVWLSSKDGLKEPDITAEKIENIFYRAGLAGTSSFDEEDSSTWEHRRVLTFQEYRDVGKPDRLRCEIKEKIRAYPTN